MIAHWEQAAIDVEGMARSYQLEAKQADCIFAEKFMADVSDAMIRLRRRCESERERHREALAGQKELFAQGVEDFINSTH